MAKRVFELPRLDQLTKDQRKVLRLPADGQYLIVGAPGTGKSVVALMRLQKLADVANVHFLTFNHVLNHANKCLVNKELIDNMHTAMSWLYTLHWNTCKKYIPEDSDYQPNYAVTIENFENAKVNLNGYSLIIDEGQDLPKGWYEAVESLNIENFFVVADQNQQITEQHSSRLELEACLGLDANEVIELKENWRNSTPIAVFCRYFYTDNASPKPVIPNRPSADIPILYEYDNLNKVKEQILREYDFDPTKLIGIFVANETKREHWAKVLAQDSEPRTYPSPVITTYFAAQKGSVNIDFDKGGIVVLNDKSVKGIEFDTVFIQTDGFKHIAGNQESLKKRLYVMASRAREKLYLFKSQVQNSILEEILPPEGETIKFTPENESEEVKQELLKRRKL